MKASEMWDTYNKFHYLSDRQRYQKLLARAEFVRMISDIPGDIADFGTFKGISTLQFANFLDIFQPNSISRVVSFDTFDSYFPRVLANEKPNADRHMAELYEETAYNQLTQAIDSLNLKNRIEIVKGDIFNTLPTYLDRNPGFRISILHCDIDVYEGTKKILELCWPRLVPNGVVIFDQYAIGGWGESNAADEFFLTLPKKPILRRLNFASTPSAYAIKE